MVTAAVPLSVPTVAVTVPEPEFFAVNLVLAPVPEKVPSELGLTDQATEDSATALPYWSLPLAVKVTLRPMRTLALDGDTEMLNSAPALTDSVRLPEVYPVPEATRVGLPAVVSW